MCVCVCVYLSPYVNLVYVYLNMLYVYLNVFI